MEEEPVAETADEDAAALRNQIKLRLLLAGVPAEEVNRIHETVPAQGEDAIALLRSKLLWGNEQPITIHEIADRAGLDVEVCRRARMLLGLADPGDAAVCRVEEVEAFEGMAAGMKLFGEEPVLHFTRVIGSALATIAEGSMSVFGRALTTMVDEGGQPLEGDEYTLASLDALESFNIVPTVLQVISKLQFDQASERLVGDPGEPRLAAVGFVDLVGSTFATEHLGMDTMAAALTRFEEWSAELAVREGGRVIKYIGDEVMFIAPTLPAASRVAVELMERIGDDDALNASRAGLAYGELLSRDGDWFGTTVNIASRLVDKAKKGTILLHGEGAVDCEGAVDKGRKRLRDIIDRVEVWRID